MTPVIIAEPCALNAMEDYSRCHVMDYRSFMYVCVWIFPSEDSHFNLICVSMCHVHALCSVSACSQKQTYRSLQYLSFTCPAACLADSRSTAGGREEPQLLSDVNAAQPLCLCGHSPSNSSNQLMGYLTLPSSPQQLSSAVSLNLVMDVVLELEQMLTAHDDMSWKQSQSPVCSDAS